jgi:hypothetical protein
LIPILLILIGILAIIFIKKIIAKKSAVGIEYPKDLKSIRLAKPTPTTLKRMERIRAFHTMPLRI